MEQDGIFNLRTVGVPVATINPISTTLQLNAVKQHGAVFGIIRQEDSTEVGTDPIIGKWGIIRSAPQHFPIGGPWGLMRRAIDDTTNTRVELFRLGKQLYQGQPFELPSRCVKYVEFWALHRAYAEDTSGNEPVLAAHYLERFKIGVQRLNKRVQAVMDERTMHMGGKRSQRQADSYLSHFPSDYGYPHKYGR